MSIEFRIEPVRHTLGVVGSDGRIYGGVRRGMPDSIPKAERMLEIVERAYEAGFRSSQHGGGGDFEIRQGTDTSGRRGTWEIVDGDGARYAAVGRGLWPRPGKDARKLLETVEHAFERGRRHVFDAMVETGGVMPERTETPAPAAPR